MRPLQNILDLDAFTLIHEGKKVNRDSCAWLKDCISSVEVSVCQDKTTTSDNLREKARNYASNYIAYSTEVSYTSKGWLLDQIADEVVKDLEKTVFDTRPPASVAAQITRKSVPKRPEEKFIRLGKS